MNKSSAIRRPQFAIWQLLVVTAIVAVILVWLNLAQPIDKRLAKEVPVVLRVEHTGIGEGSKYIWVKVKVLRVLKNESDFEFEDTIDVAHLGFNGSIPGGVSTIYLVPYADPHDNKWKLFVRPNGVGVSHQADISP